MRRHLPPQGTCAQTNKRRGDCFVCQPGQWGRLRVGSPASVCVCLPVISGALGQDHRSTIRYASKQSSCFVSGERTAVASVADGRPGDSFVCQTAESASNTQLCLLPLQMQAQCRMYRRPYATSRICMPRETRIWSLDMDCPAMNLSTTSLGEPHGVPTELTTQSQRLRRGLRPAYSGGAVSGTSSGRFVCFLSEQVLVRSKATKL